jgi:NAD+-dependent secondary alcohol dehydrogenase Adh1
MLYAQRLDNACLRISTEINFIGYHVGGFNDLVELMTLTALGKVKQHTTDYPLDSALNAIHNLDSGKLRGRGILVLKGQYDACTDSYW